MQWVKLQKILQRGTRCIKVDGVLTVPYGKEVAMKQKTFPVIREFAMHYGTCSHGRTRT